MRGREKKSMLELITVNSQELGKAAVVMDLFALFLLLPSLSHYLRGGFVVSGEGRADAVRAFEGAP